VCTAAWLKLHPAVGKIYDFATPQKKTSCNAAHSCTGGTNAYLLAYKQTILTDNNANGDHSTVTVSENQWIKTTLKCSDIGYQSINISQKMSSTPR